MSRTPGYPALQGMVGLLALAACVCGNVSRSAGREQLTLIAGGHSTAAIVTPATVSAQEQRMVDIACATLVEHFRQMSGADVAVLREGALGNVTVEDGRIIPERGGGSPAGVETFILLHESTLTRKLEVTTTDLGRGGMRVKTSGNALILMGPPDGTTHSGGTVYAAVTFLEVLGCRYLWPGETGKVVPRRATIETGPLDIVYTPPVGQRHVRFMTEGPRGFSAGLRRLLLTRDEYERSRAQARLTVASGSWATWNFLGGSIGICGGHAGAGLIGGWETHGTGHPEWFAQQNDGTRDQSAAGNRWRLCVSNPGLIEHVANDITERANADPNLKCVMLSPNDGGYSSFCMCPACKALDPDTAPKISLKIFAQVGKPKSTTLEYPALTDRYVHYWNAVAERVVRVHPKLLFSIDAYSVYTTPPVRERLHPNLIVRYVPSRTQGWDGWRKTGAKRIYWRPNILHSGYREGSLNRFVARQLAETLSLFADNGMLATDISSIYGFWATMGLGYYVAARLSWNPDLTYDAVLDDYCTAGFGPAASELKTYFLRVEKLKGPPENYTGPTADELRALLDAADRAARDDADVRKRIDFLRTGLEYTIITAQACRLANDVNEGRPVDRAAAHELLDRRWLLMRGVALQCPLAINAPVVAGNDGRMTMALGWKGPGKKTKQKVGMAPPDDVLRPPDQVLGEPEDDWLDEEQIELPDDGDGK